MQKICLVTYIYPSVKKYLHELVLALNNQTYTAFEVLIFNDGVENISKIFKKLDSDYEIIFVNGSPNEIRFKSLFEIKKRNYEYIIFQDSDDFPDNNRIEEVISMFHSYDIVVNDLNMVNEEGDLIQEGVWSKRLGKTFQITSNFLVNKNIVGLGNTAIRRSVLNRVDIQFSPKPIAYDWFMFYQMLKENHLKAIFISSTCTNYRQHDKNIAGLYFMNEDRLKHIQDVKIKHFEALLDLGYNMQSELKKVKNLVRIRKTKSKKDYYTYIPFWWEETERK